jgi:hypothetical protein
MQTLAPRSRNEQAWVDLEALSIASRNSKAPTHQPDRARRGGRDELLWMSIATATATAKHPPFAKPTTLLLVVNMLLWRYGGNQALTWHAGGS